MTRKYQVLYLIKVHSLSTNEQFNHSMYHFFKKPEIPTSSPDKLTFPFDYSTFKYTMENYVKSFTRNRVTKENLIEILDEINSTLRSDADSFKLLDYIAVILIFAINLGVLFCILTLETKNFTMFGIKLAFIVFGILMSFILWGCCLDGKIDNMRNKVQYVLDTKDDYFDSKGMRWTVCSETEFPYWVELHIQSQFEMKLAQEKEAREGKKPKKDKEFSESRGILESRVTSDGRIIKPKVTSLLAGRIAKNNINFDVDEELEENEVSQIQAQPKKEIDIENQNDRKFNRLYAPLEEDYEANYEDEGH